MVHKQLGTLQTQTVSQSSIRQALSPCLCVHVISTAFLFSGRPMVLCALHVIGFYTVKYIGCTQEIMSNGV